MKIDAYQVSMKSHHERLEMNESKVGEYETHFENSQEVKEEERKSKKNTLSSDYIIGELSNAIMRNLFLLSNMGVIEMDEFEFVHYEEESLNFQTQAFICANDKEICVNLDVNLKRSFLSKTNMNSSMLFDPLIISLDGDMPALSEKSFAFDIDSDGKKDQISLLAKQSGFLALDKNNNGKIDDGNELFGAKSGDGFNELKLYDKDGNNWIDENDEIFDKLRIWQKTDRGDKLVGLGEAGIGAIFLGNTDTSFDVKSIKDNSMLGKIRSSGFFVKENGNAGIISQIDLAKQNLKPQNNDILSQTLALFGDEFDGIFQTPKRKQSLVLDILTQRIKQMEDELLDVTNKDKSILQNRISIMEDQLRYLEKIAI